MLVIIVWVMKCGCRRGLVVGANAYEVKVLSSNPAKGPLCFFLPLYAIYHWIPDLNTSKRGWPGGALGSNIGS